MPQVFWRWIAAEPSLLAIYESALEIRAHVFAEELIAIADDSAGDWIVGERGPEPNPESVQRAKLRVSTRQWVMSRLLPKKYGDRLAVAHSGGDELVAALREGRERALTGG